MKEKLNVSTNLALLLLGVFCQTEMLRKTLGFPVQPHFYYCLVLLCIGLWYTAHGRRFNGIGILVSLCILFLVYRLERSDILSQLTDFFGKIGSLVSERFLLNTDSYPYSPEASGYSILFLTLAFLEAAYLSIALSSRGARTDLALLGTLPFSVFCVAVSETPPLLPLLGMLLFWFLTALGGSYYRKESGSSIGVLTALLPLVALLAILLLIVSPQNYEYQPPQLRFVEQLSAIGKTIRQLAEKLPHEDMEISLPAQYAPRETGLTEPSSVQQGEPFSLQEISPSSMPQDIPVNILWQNTDGKMDLTMETDPATLDKVFLRVRSSESGPIYLRALSFGDYTGTGWLPAQDTLAPVSSLPFTAQALAFSGAAKKQLSFHVLLPAFYRFTPYFCEDSGSLDSYIPSGEQLSYTLEYRLAGSSPETAYLPKELSAAELFYREYAHNYYTRLPDATRSSLQALLKEKALFSSDTLISDIAAFIQQAGQYDIETGVYPSNDYALYFLTEAKRGYCIHFATAAAALYRAAGIPARVTEGFLVRAIAGKTVDVTGADAHAWVEIYLDGLGWLPVEVTGQNGLESASEGVESAEIQEPEPEMSSALEEEAGSNPASITPAKGTSSPAEERKDITVAPPEPENFQVQEPTQQTTTPEMTIPSPSPTTQLQVGIISDPSSSDKSENSFSLLWLMFLPVLIVVALPILRFCQRQRKSPDAHSVVIAVYNIFLSLSTFNVSLPPDIKNYAEKAAFSRNSVTGQEAESCKAYLYTTLSQLNTELKHIKRLHLSVMLLRFHWHYPWLILQS